MTGRSDRRPSDPTMILFRVRTCHMPRKRIGLRLSRIRRETGGHAASSLSDSKVGDVSSIRDPTDFTKRPCVQIVHQVK